MDESKAPPQIRRRRYGAPILAACAVIGVVLFAYWLRDIFTSVLVALLLAYLLDPVVGALEKMGLSRVKAVLAVFAAATLLVAAAAALLVPPAVGAIWRCSSNLPAYIDELGRDATDPQGRVARLVDRIGGSEATRRVIDEIVVHVQDNAKAIALQATDEVRAAAAGVLGGIWSFLAFLLGIVMIPVYLFFFLRDFRDLRGGLLACAPPGARERLRGVFGKINRCVGAFLRGRLIICSLVGALTAIGFYICKVPFGIFLGLGVGAAMIIPFLNILPGVVAILLAIVAGDPWYLVLAALMVYGTGQAIDVLLTPMIIGKELAMHPVLLILAIFVFGRLFGFFGLLLAIPMAAILRILFVELVLPRLREISSR